MHTLTFIAAAGALAACSLLPDQAPLAADPLSALERACLEDPGDAPAWERLGEAAKPSGQGAC